jgi:uracil-DNA glycosylase family 4
MVLILTSAMPPEHPLSQLAQQISQCTACSRLTKYCQKIAVEKKRAHRSETYWGRPVSGFGDHEARLVIVGLAPAAHGANRTGRMFTGDRSGLWLYRALHKHGFSNQSHSEHANDKLKLRGCYVTSVVKCAPPENKPSPQEIIHCQKYIQSEIDFLKSARVYLALGKIALDGLWSILKEKYALSIQKPNFKHGLETELVSNKIYLITSYHPSQQNTFTGRLTEPMFDDVFMKAKKRI